MPDLRVAWNKGLTKETDSRVAKYSNSISKSRIGFKHTEETKQKMSLNRTGKNNAMWGKPQSDLCKETNRIRMIGNKCAAGTNSPHLSALNKSRIGIPISDEVKQKQRESILKYWNSEDGIKQRQILSKVNRQWAKDNPEEKIKAAKNGHKQCPKISSLEKTVETLLKQNNIDFIPQYEYELGFMDFFVKPNIALFVNGNYWHNYPHGTEKDKRQLDFLKSHGYSTLVIWEKELKNPEAVIEKIQNTFYAEGLC